MKKVFLACVAAVTVVAAATYFARHAIGSLIIDYMAAPFDPATAPPAPDYADPASWAALPGCGSAGERIPEGLVEEPSPARGRVDVFYIHPTGFANFRDWNGLAHEGDSYRIPVSAMLAAQASAFNGAGQVYAPRYRQASFLAYAQALLAPGRTDGLEALDLAYEDIARAFDYFLAHHNRDRPFLVVGHSQGAGHAMRLLAEKVDGTPAYGRFVAAYVVGATMPMDYFDRVYSDIAPCTAPCQTGCIVAWDTVREGARLPVWAIHRYPHGWEYLARGAAVFCVNPLAWTDTAERVPAAQHAGALLTRLVPLSHHPDGCVFEGISPAHTWAERRGGRLWVADQAGTVFNNRRGIYHKYDFSLFWMNIRANARLRAETFLQEHGLQEHGLQERGLQEHGLQEHGLQEHGLQEHGPLPGG